MIRVIRTAALRGLQEQAAEVPGLRKALNDAQAATARLAKTVEAGEQNERAAYEVYVRLGEATAKIRQLTAALDTALDDRDDARADLAQIDRAAVSGMLRVVPPPRGETIAAPAAPVVEETRRRMWEYPHESTEPALIVEHADQGCTQCSKALKELPFRSLHQAMAIAMDQKLAIAQLLITSDFLARLRAGQLDTSTTEAEEGKE